MRKVLLATIIILFSGFIYIKAGQTANFSDLLPRLRGYILLQVEANGEAWYVNPLEDARIYMKNGTVAYSVMANLGLGITNSDLAKIPVGVEERFECADNDNDGLCNKLEEGLETDINDSDSDNDGYADGTEVLSGYDALGLAKLNYDYALTSRLKGRIVLQVQEKGQAWYINPSDGKRYYMTDGEAAYQIMRFLSLGITNSDLERIPISVFDISENIITPPDSSGDDSGDSGDGSGDQSQCGNNIVETGEECDGSAPAGYTCTSACQLLADTLTGGGGGGTVPNPVVPSPAVPQCGNNIVETGEECDGSAPAGYTCDSQCNLSLLPVAPAYSVSIAGPYQSDVVLAQSDAPEGSAYSWKINNQTVESGISPTIFLAHYDGNTNTAFGEEAVSTSGISFVSSNFSQGMKGRAQYPRLGNLDFSQGTLEMWLTLTENISSTVFDSDPYIFRYQNLASKDNFYFSVNSNNALNFTMYDDSYGWTQAAQLNSGQYDVLADKEIMVVATWSQADTAVKFYLNGEQVSRRDYDSSFPLIASGTENIELGHASVAVDEVRILNKALSVDEIKENYRRSAPFSKNDILYSGDFSSGNSVNISLTTNLGQITDSATVSGKKISITSPAGYFVTNTNSIGVSFNTPTSMTCRYGTEPNLYDKLPYSAGTGTAHNINLTVSDQIEPVPVAIKCRDSAGQSDDYGFFRQYHVLPQVTSNYPKLSRIWWGNTPKESEVAYLSKFDMVSFSKSTIVEPDVVRQIKQANPKEVILIYKSAVGLQNYSGVAYGTLRDRVDDSLRLQSSEEAASYCLNYFFPQNIIYNVYNSRYAQTVAEHLEKDIFDRYHLLDGLWWDVTGPSLWFLRDPGTGLYADWCDFNLDGLDEDLNDAQTFTLTQGFWSQGIHNEMLAARQVLGQNMLTIGNGHSPDHSDYNGKLWEETFDYITFSNYFDPSYIHGFLYWQEHSLTPRLNDNLFANNYLEGSASFYKYHRFGLVSSLIAGIYYNPQVINQDRNWWWFDEYWVNTLTALPTTDRTLGAGYLGEPVGPAYIDSNLVWRRDFQNGIVLVNNTATLKNVNLFGQFREIVGTQDRTINGGQTITSLQLSAYDGRILLRSLCEDNPYQDPWCIGDYVPIIDPPDIQG